MFTKFNRVLLASGLVLTSLVGFGSSAFADSINLNGEIPAESALDTTNINLTDWDFGATSGIEVAHTTVTDRLLGTMVIRNNDFDGFDVKISSLNGGKLIHTRDTETPVYPVAYTLSVDQLSASSGSSHQTPTDGTEGNGLWSEDFSTDCAEVNGCTRKLFLTVTNTGTEVDKYPAGDYKDTLTITLASKE
jgi:hypothetical protein